MWVDGGLGAGAQGAPVSPHFHLVTLCLAMTQVLKWLLDAGVPVTDTHPDSPNDQPLHMACYQVCVCLLGLGRNGMHICCAACRVVWLCAALQHCILSFASQSSTAVGDQFAVSTLQLFK